MANFEFDPNGNGINYNSPTIQLMMSQQAQNAQNMYNNFGNMGGNTNTGNPYLDALNNGYVPNQYDNYNQYYGNPYDNYNMNNDYNQNQYYNNPYNNMGYNQYYGNPYDNYNMNNGYNQNQYYNNPYNNMGYNQYSGQSVLNNGNPYLDTMNGGYYSGYYTMNPQELMRQAEAQRRAEEEAIRNYIEIQIMKNEIYNSFFGKETDREYLERYYNPNTYSEIYKDLEEYDEMCRLSEIANNPMNRIDLYNPAAAEYAKISNEIRSKHPIDQSFEDYLATAGDIYQEALLSGYVREMKKNIANTYDHNAYQQLVTAYRKNNPYVSLRQTVTADDLSICLPDHLKRSDDYNKRKNAFLNHVMSKDKRNRNRGVG